MKKKNQGVTESILLLQMCWRGFDLQFDPQLIVRQIEHGANSRLQIILDYYLLNSNCLSDKGKYEAIRALSKTPIVDIST